MEMSLWLSMLWIWSCLKVITCFFCPQARWDAKTNDFFLHPQRWANESITPPHIRIFLRTTRCQSCFMITTRHPWIASVRSPLTPFLRTIDAHHRQATMHDVIACWLRSNEIEAKKKWKRFCLRLNHRNGWEVQEGLTRETFLFHENWNEATL